MSHQLALSEGTVRRKRGELFQVLGVRGWAEAVHLAYKWGLAEVRRGKLRFRPVVWEMLKGIDEEETDS